QREAFAADARLVAARIHVPEHLGLADRLPVLEGEQGRDRRGAAAEVVLLRHRGAVAGRLEAGHRHRIVAAVGQAGLGSGGPGQGRRTGLPTKTGQREHEPRSPAPFHGPPLPKRTLTAVPFWISTLAPLFWI